MADLPCLENGNVNDGAVVNARDAAIILQIEAGAIAWAGWRMF